MIHTILSILCYVFYVLLFISILTGAFGLIVRNAPKYVLVIIAVLIPLCLTYLLWLRP